MLIGQRYKEITTLVIKLNMNNDTAATYRLLSTIIWISQSKINDIYE